MTQRFWTCLDTASCVESGDGGAQTNGSSPGQSSGSETTVSSGEDNPDPTDSNPTSGAVDTSAGENTAPVDSSGCDECSLGDAKCVDGRQSTCELIDSCWVWSAPHACEQGTCADASSCSGCADVCEAGDERCVDGGVQTCEVAANGCADWSAPILCATQQCANDSECFVCDDKCQIGEARCADGQLEHCITDERGCLGWQDSTACDTGTCATPTSCTVCDDKCSIGDAQFSCSGNQLSACAADEQGCYDYELEATCGGDTPVCNANRGRCECESGGPPMCKNGTTVSQCSNGAWTDSACSGNKPVCVEGAGCVACTEHSQCPNSACHLSGSKKGTCFSTNTVVNVNSAATLLSAVKATKADGEAVIRLSAGTYTVKESLALNGETAIIGQAGVVIVDDIPSPSDARAAFIFSSNMTYLAKFELTSLRRDHAAIGSHSGGVMWLDDLRVHGVYIAVLAHGEGRLRRTSLYDYASGVLAYYGGSLFIENSMIGPGANNNNRVGVGAYFGAVLDVRYSTIVGNERGVSCSVGDTTGRISNSVIASLLNGYSIADGQGDCSEAFSLVNNAVDQSGYGTKIPVYSSTWFVSANNGDLHLSAAGQVAIPTIAVRGSGDPLSDFDGAARPASAGYPGADQP